MAHPSRVQVDRHAYLVQDVVEGGFGKVWLLKRPDGAPENTIYGRTRAAKTFKCGEDEGEGLIEQELGNWATLYYHPNILPLIKIARLNFQLAALMEWMPGTLGDYIRWHGPMFPPERVKSILLDVLRGLDFAHQKQRLAHLDLKPNNLLVTSTNDSAKIKISDWGLARLAMPRAEHKTLLGALRNAVFGPDLQRTQTIMGTFGYFGPERLSGSWTIGPAADLFSVGVIAVQLLTGVIPTIDPKGDRERTIGLIVSCDYLTRARSLLGTCNKPLGDLVLKMLDPEPAHRPASYEQLLGTMETI